MTHYVPPPTSEQELVVRAEALAGHSLAELAERDGCCLPSDPRHAKGWIGQLLERLLGADANSRPVPDFSGLGIELKSIPINEHQQPAESTYVCTAPLLSLTTQTWRTSTVYHKLQRVLWLPIEASKSIEFSKRRVGLPILWSASKAESQLLQADWELLTDYIRMGRVESLTAKMGEALQVRPKAANSKALCQAIGEDGETIMTLPRGFYLRTSFTAEILRSR